jgi:hypothetical protein
MRTAIIILVGLAIWAVSLLLARRYGTKGGTAVEDVTLAFITIWLLAAATNFWIGVTQGGYSFRQELPVFVLIFLVPAGVAALVRWKFFPSPAIPAPSRVRRPRDE